MVFAANTHCGIWYASNLGELKCFKKKEDLLLQLATIFLPDSGLGWFQPLHHQHQQNGVPENGPNIKTTSEQTDSERLTQIFQCLQGKNSTLAI